MPFLLRNQNTWKASGSVVGGGQTGGGGTGGTGGGTSTAGTLARPFSADSAWNSPFTGAETWQTFSQLPKTYWLNDGTTGGTGRVYDVGAGTITVNVTIPVAYRGYPAGTIAWPGIPGMAPSIGGGGDNPMSILWTSPTNGVRYLLDLWATARQSDTAFTAQAFGVSNIDGLAGHNVPGKTIAGHALWAPGNGWGDHAPGDFNAAKVAGVTETEAPWFGGLITPWAVAAGKIDYALGCALPSNVMGNVRYRPSLMQWHGANGPLMQGMRIGFPGAPRPNVSGITGMVVDAAMKYGIYIRDATGGASTIIYAHHDLTGHSKSGIESAMNQLGPYGKITTTLPAGVSPAT